MENCEWGRWVVIRIFFEGKLYGKKTAGNNHADIFSEVTI